ncbi:uncharacterized protein PGTG_08293 [Puccinia graminis f. sp. tritici CRL 75-36-700-3]|uniref:Uncharacterized protein n=1 Tax=Puccinia graminis f. sp. tritici (strain CRL 75-36-700-3 / race SCCL) TaxID=418459 RepID=E3KDV3_PUCGT|nr:uncharacterized protein PGTG_08293 [Puccinia graminis f. sp. tritici CRL 75-36-700-3]EFP82337.1 hypothetical protein PGTG_08293 [Puccinia graminis f. sp. tritici CRL 75-36-700-3]
MTLNKLSTEPESGIPPDPKRPKIYHDAIVNVGIQILYHIWLADPLATETTHGKRNVRQIKHWTLTSGPPEKLYWGGDPRNYSWQDIKQEIIAKVLHHYPEVGHEMRTNDDAGELFWEGIISTQGQIRENDGEFIYGHGGWTHFAHKSARSPPFEKFIIRVCTFEPNMPTAKQDGLIRQMVRTPHIATLSQPELQQHFEDCLRARAKIVDGQPVIFRKVDSHQYIQLTPSVVQGWVQAMLFQHSPDVDEYHPPQGHDYIWLGDDGDPTSPSSSNLASDKPTPSITPKPTVDGQPPASTIKRCPVFNPDPESLEYHISDMFSRASDNLQLHEFLKVACIPEDDTETRQLISDLKITHWSWFKHTTTETLTRIKFAPGPAKTLAMAAERLDTFSSCLFRL